VHFLGEIEAVRAVGGSPARGRDAGRKLGAGETLLRGGRHLHRAALRGLIMAPAATRQIPCSRSARSDESRRSAEARRAAWWGDDSNSRLAARLIHDRARCDATICVLLLPAHATHRSQHGTRKMADAARHFPTAYDVLGSLPICQVERSADVLASERTLHPD
jgi:hypothetical protein